MTVSWLHTTNTLAAQSAGLDARLSSGAAQRIQDPDLYDLVFPFIAFGFVVVIPIGIALWVIYRTLTQKEEEADTA